MIQRVLTEIPIRMDRLRVSTDEDGPNVLQDIAIDNSFDNVNYYLSPSASPDEMIIRQRGNLFNNLVNNCIM